MSRTYRTKLEWKYDAYGRLWTNDELEQAGLGPRYVWVPCPWPDPVPDWAAGIHKPGDPGFTRVWVTPGLKGRDVVNRRARDGKTWDKPPKWFKQQNRRRERARVRDAMARRTDIPLFKHTDQWEWT